MPLLRARDEDWAGAQALARAAAQDAPIRAVAAIADYAYLYLRVDVAPGALDWGQQQIWLALNTLPGTAGARALPDTTLRVPGGANFLVQLAGPGAARVLVSPTTTCPSTASPCLGTGSVANRPETAPVARPR